jgi:pimeloyl-ACP methyl ester carboxylesterase
MSTVIETQFEPEAAPRREARGLGRRLARAVLAVALVLTLTAAGGAVWLAVGDSAHADDLALALSTHGVTITDDGEVLTIAPTAVATVGVGIAFLPGTRIERDAYVATLAPIVEATGITAYVAAMPLNLPALADDPIGDIIAAHPETATWVVGGHSMGGFQAAAFAAAAAETPAGLLLWASGPARTELAGLDLPTLVVAGAEDTVLPLDRILGEGSLPATAEVELIAGMVHGQFGRYSDTDVAAGDPTHRPDADTLTDLVAATVTFLDEVTGASFPG